jgi:hypothetical protein
LRKLENSSTFERWLTSADDDEKWEQYAKENGFTDKSLVGKKMKDLIDFLVFFDILESSLTLTFPTKKYLSVQPAATN